jgi:putative membrane protein
MNKNNWITRIILGIVVLLSMVAVVYLLSGWNNSQWGMMGNWGTGMMHGYGFNTFGWIGMALTWLIPIGILVLVVIGINVLVRGFVNGGYGETSLYTSADNKPTAQEIIQTRYARGEISREQFKEMLDDIR